MPTRRARCRCTRLGFSCRACSPRAGRSERTHTTMNYQEEFSRGYAGHGLPNDADALAAWNAGVRTREENERVTHANSANATDLSVTVPQFGGRGAAAAATTPLAPG